MQVKAFRELSLDELYDILKLRQDVFVCEQNIIVEGQSCVFHDIDYKDQGALHFLRYREGKLEGYARLFEGSSLTIGRIVTPLHARGRGVGAAFIKGILAYTQKVYPGCDIHIDAQTRLEGFYSKLGFVTMGPVFYFEGDPIPHVPMVFKPSEPC